LDGRTFSGLLKLTETGAGDGAIERRMRGLLAASRGLLDLIVRGRDERTLLQVAVEMIAGLLEVKYGAIGVLDENDRHRHFVHCGITAEQQAAIGPLPSGHGVLGQAILANAPLRLDDIGASPHAVGFPARHPDMDTMLAVPLYSLGRPYGRLYLCDRLDGERFSELDELIAAHFCQYLSFALEKIHQIEHFREKDEAHRQGEERYRLLVQMAPEPIFVLQDGHVAFANESTLRVMGARDLRELGERPFLDMVMPPFRLAVEAGIRNIEAGQRLPAAEIEIRNLAGRLMQIEVSGAPLSYYGRPAILGVARDITRQKRDEHELRALHQLSDLVNRGVEQEGLYGEALRALRAITGADMAAISLRDKHGVLRPVAWDGNCTDSTWAAIEPTSAAASPDEEAAPVVATDVAEHPRLAAHRDELAAAGVVSLAALPMLHQHSMLGQMCIGFADRHEFTEAEVRVALTIGEQVGVAVARKHSRDKIRRLNAELEARVRRRTKELEDANRELEAFAYSVSHDLRGPLRAINGYSKILLDDYAGSLDLTAHNHLGRIIAGSQRMELLIDDLLRLSRVNRSQVQIRRFDPTAIAESIVAKLRETGPLRQVEAILQPIEPVEADPGLVRIVLENLLSNAWKYTGKTERARIEFGRTEDQSRPVYFVADNGAGFDMAYASKLFKPFQRLHPPSEFEGVGVGLALVQRIIRRLGGRIWANARPNEGATFYFTLWEEGIPDELRARSD
jgi:PAS domain S-box-containing protein